MGGGRAAVGRGAVGGGRFKQTDAPSRFVRARGTARAPVGMRTWGGPRRSAAAAADTAAASQGIGCSMTRAAVAAASFERARRRRGAGGGAGCRSSGAAGGAVAGPRRRMWGANDCSCMRQSAALTSWLHGVGGVGGGASAVRAGEGGLRGWARQFDCAAWRV
eukprot:355096-Chlamydomonas_euryale.AAC.10